MILLIDTNVILDVFLNRTAFLEPSKKILNMCKSGSVQGVLAAHSLSNMWYILRKEYNDEERRALLFSLLDVFDVIALDRAKLVSALERDNFADFEDSLQDECATEIRADYIVTRNKKDFKRSKVRALSPEELVELLSPHPTV
ncbi:MAG: PIN domain-containing protein [Treponema sp.]|nr:PIN domain-containing protein [Treponema sp.]